MDYTVHGILQARILEWVAFPTFPTQASTPGQVSCTADGFFSSWSIRETQEYWRGWPSRSRNWTGVSCIAGGFCINWASREAPGCRGDNSKYKCWEMSLMTETMSLMLRIWVLCKGANPFTGYKFTESVFNKIEGGTSWVVGWSLKIILIIDHCMTLVYHSGVHGIQRCCYCQTSITICLWEQGFSGLNICKNEK